MSEPGSRELVKEFFASLDDLQYPQPIVGDAIVCPQTDLNLWRKREMIPADMWEKNGRVTFTGKGLIFAGIFNDLAWTLGPTRASEAATALLPFIEDTRRAVANGDFSFAEIALHFGKPIPAKGELDKARVIKPTGKPKLTDGLGLPLRLSDFDSLRANPIPNATTVITPIGESIYTNAWRARLALREA